MTELKMELSVLFGGLLMTGFAFVYQLGGRHRLFWRRWFGGLMFPALMQLFLWWQHHWSLWMLGSWIAYPLWLSQGYGATELAAKVRRRALYGVYAGLAAATLILPQGLWGVWAFQMMVALAASLFYGVVNPLSAIGEEGILGVLFVICVAFSGIH